MSTESSDLKPMGTQSKETMDLEAAQAARRGHGGSTEAAADNANTRETAKDTVDQGLAALQAATERMRRSALDASKLAVNYTKEEPFKALLIAAATGALLMGIIVMMARSKD